ncbi:thiamine phosphate synthase [Mangrovibacterium lignilyticum]|uniref:thiamine phosphate synthase n=1 Tax=Mangrovibacterium lignilyticum TaxID=2668052 RepID=UPI001967284E|nr:thiamine phosphate synthase [Mangrovibacterium lignilyticum]
MNQNNNLRISPLQFITHPTEQVSPSAQARQVLEGGCNWIQLRMKKHSVEQICAEAEKIKALKGEFDFTFILNDHPDLALKLGADGVHLGKQDCSPAEARKLLGSGYIIGGTANSLEDIERLAAQGVDYIGLGPFRFTATKENLSPVLGLTGYSQLIRQMKDRGIDLPVIGIGGVEPEDINDLMLTRLHGLAISSAIWKSPSIAACTHQWLEAISKASTHQTTTL